MLIWLLGWCIGDVSRTPALAEIILEIYFMDNLGPGIILRINFIITKGVNVLITERKVIIKFYDIIILINSAPRVGKSVIILIFVKSGVTLKPFFKIVLSVF